MIYGREDRIRELQAEIDRLRAEQEAPPVWTPDFAEAYYYTDSGEVSKYHFYDDFVDNNCLEVGNVFKTKQEAEDYIRALALIETIRRERYKAQGEWWPSISESRYAMYWNLLKNSIGITHTIWSFASNVFGFWQGSDVLRDVIKKYEPELEWYFVDYLPSIN